MTRPEDQDVRPACERCGSTLTPIVYGYPTHETFEAADRGEVVLGGCLTWEGRPRAVCRTCEENEVAGG